MALIKCNECGKEISDKATTCVNCGCPIENNEIEIKNKINDILIKNEYKKAYTILECKKIFNISQEEIKRIVDELELEHEKSLKQRTCNYNDYEKQQLNETDGRNRPKCPTCGSTNVEKLKMVGKIVSTGLFGLASGSVAKTMHCKNCGYKW